MDRISLIDERIRILRDARPKTWCQRFALQAKSHFWLSIVIAHLYWTLLRYLFGLALFRLVRGMKRRF